MRKRDALGHAEEVTFADLPMPPLLGGVRFDGLERDKGPVDPFVDRGVDACTRTGPAPQRMLAAARNDPAVDREELGVLAAGRCEPSNAPRTAPSRRTKTSMSVLLSPAFIPAVGAGDVDGELGHGDHVQAIGTERFHGSCTRRVNSLHFGNLDDHGCSHNTTGDARHKYLRLTIADPYRKYF